MNPSRSKWAVAITTLVLVGLTGAAWITLADRSNTMANASTLGRTSPSGQTETATFGAGCFWGVESAFRQIEGVLNTTVGYSGGHTDDPTYRQVCSDATGHAEVVQVVFDPQIVGYERLLDVFWKIHDPTQVNRQGPDFGSQYRSAIFTYSDAQAAAAQEAKRRLDESGKYRRPVATEIAPAGAFWPAEEYHQQYFEKNGGPACHIAP